MQVTGSKTQLAIFKPVAKVPLAINAPALVAIAVVSAATVVVVGNAFKAICPISPAPLIIEPAFLPLFVTSSSISISILLSSNLILFFLLSKSSSVN